MSGYLMSWASVFCQGREFAMSHPKSSRCTICRVQICVGTNPKQICRDFPW